MSIYLAKQVRIPRGAGQALAFPQDHLPSHDRQTVDAHNEALACRVAGKSLVLVIQPFPRVYHVYAHAEGHQFPEILLWAVAMLRRYRSQRRRVVLWCSGVPVWVLSDVLHQPSTRPVNYQVSVVERNADGLPSVIVDHAVRAGALGCVDGVVREEGWLDPCAPCVDEHEGDRVEPPLEVRLHEHGRAASPMGRYGAARLGRGVVPVHVAPPGCCFAARPVSGSRPGAR